MKKIMCMGVVLAAGMFVAACSGKEETSYEDQEWRTTIRETADLESYEDGVYYANQDQVLCYFDVSSQKSAVLCKKKGCGHVGETCDAYLDISGLPDAANGSLYYLSAEGVLSKTKLDNTEEEKIWDMGEELYEKMGDETNLMFLSYLVTGNDVYSIVRMSYMDEEGTYQEREELHVLDLKKKKDTVLEEVDATQYALELTSAKNQVVYYQIKSMYDKAFNPDTATQKEWQEQEKKMTTKLYRVDAETGEKEERFMISGGFILAASDEIGVYYNDFLGTGYMETKNLYRKSWETGEETVLKKGEELGIYYCAVTGAEDLVLWNTNDVAEMYNMKEFTKEPVAIRQENPVMYPVKGGYFRSCAKEQDGIVWQYVPEEEAGKEDGKAVDVRE